MVKTIQSIGAFLEWGQPKELFLPEREQTEELFEGEWIIVFIHLDNSGRPIASMRLDEFVDHDTSQLFPEQQVELLVLGETDLGFQCAIDGRYIGVLYRSEVFQDLSFGSQVTGYVKKIREDGKVDLILQRLGNKGAMEIGERILDELRVAGGFLPLTDKSTPEEIYDLFEVSKKKFKMALGALYRKELITLHQDGLRLKRQASK